MERTTETEVKIPVSDLERVRERLLELDAERVIPSARETNIVFDFADARLQNAESLLRLRKFGERWRLTFKGPPSFEGAVKHREELEFGLDDGAVLAHVLERLGLEPIRRYEKDREYWRFEGVEVTLDRTPMGSFVEIEGQSDLLESAARHLGLDVDRGVRGSYLALWEEFRRARSDRNLPQDMVFEE